MDNNAGRADLNDKINATQPHQPCSYSTPTCLSAILTRADTLFTRLDDVSTRLDDVFSESDDVFTRADDVFTRADALFPHENTNPTRLNAAPTHEEMVCFQVEFASVYIRFFLHGYRAMPDVKRIFQCWKPRMSENRKEKQDKKIFGRYIFRYFLYFCGRKDIFYLKPRNASES